MTEGPDGPVGEPMASGRAADVYDLGDGTVLRRYRTARDVEPEAQLMRWLHGEGYPVPEVHRFDGGDLVMARIDGPTMAEEIARRPWRAGANIATLADLQRTLGSLPAPSWVAAGDGIPPGSSVVHLDLHPMNVILSPAGPVVIDWTNARRGHADFDASMTFVLAATAELDNRIEWAGARLLARLFRRRRGRAAVDHFVAEAAELRLVDPNTTEAERARLTRLRRGR